MNAKKEAVMNAVRNEIALTNAQQLMNVNSFCLHKLPHKLISAQSANERCYKACITKPGTSCSFFLILFQLTRFSRHKSIQWRADVLVAVSRSVYGSV